MRSLRAMGREAARIFNGGMWLAALALLVFASLVLVACKEEKKESAAPTKTPEAAARTPAGGEATKPPLAAGPFVGSDTCGNCHSDQYDAWIESGHPHKLTKAADAQKLGLPLPEGYTWDDISYVIGGYKWKARYMDKDGFIITSTGPNKDQPGKNQYNLATKQWVDYKAGEKTPYDCGGCHTTGYSKEGSQGGLPGIVGTWVFESIQCEACHGPGRDHADSPAPDNIKIDRSSAACGACHVRGKETDIPAKGGFIEHHEQYNELLASPHSGLDCTSCHDPHAKSEESIKTECAACHGAVQEEFSGSLHDSKGLECSTCHMAMATKSAVAESEHKGDVRTHIFRINADPTAKMFSEDGSLANDSVTLDFVCLQCHDNKDVQWAGTKAEGVHILGK